MEFNITLEQFQNAVEIMPMEDSGDLVINATIGSTGGGGDVTYLSQLIQDPLHRTVTDNEKVVWNGKADALHTHDDLYYRKEDVDTLTESKANIIHNHDATYYTKEETDAYLVQKADAGAVPTHLNQLAEDPEHRTVTDSEKSTWNSKSTFSGSYTDLENIPTSFPPSAHNHNESYYQKGEVDSFLSQKAGISDIPTELADLSEDTSHRVVTDIEKTTWNNKSDFSGAYNDLTGKPTQFPPETHSHTIGDVQLLQSSLDSMATEAELISGLAGKEDTLLTSQKLKITLSTDDPSGTDWDIWIKHEA